MDLLSDLVQAVRDDLSVDSTSTLYNETVIKRVLNRAYNKCGGLYRWPELEDAKKTSSIADQEYYDYPDNWQPDSVWKLKVDDDDYGDPLVYMDYLLERENTFPSGLTKAWSSQWRRFFVYPVPTTDGNNNICVWGQKVVDPLVSDASTTIFSYSFRDCNEAIVLETVAILKAKGDQTQEGQFRSLEAKGILANAWQKIRQNQVKYEKTQPKFEVPDFFATSRSRKTRIGDFN